MTNEELVAVLLNGQIQLQQTVSDLAKTVEAYADLENRRSERLTAAQESLADLIGRTATTVGNFVRASDARMKQLEASMDALIRAITAEHTNGKKKAK